MAYWKSKTLKIPSQRTRTLHPKSFMPFPFFFSVLPSFPIHPFLNQSLHFLKQSTSKQMILAMVSGSELTDELSTSFIQRHHNNKHFPVPFWEIFFVFADVFLEILVLIFDGISSIQNPQYGLIAWELSAAVMFVCVAELIYRGLVQEKMTFLQCLKAVVPCSSGKKPYGWIDGVVLGFAKIQMVFCAFSYGCLTQGKESPVCVSVVSVIFISGFVVYHVCKKRFCRGSNDVLPVTQGQLS